MSGSCAKSTRRRFLFELACSVCSAIAMVAVGTSSAGDWPQFLGPQRNGISNETGLLATWPAHDLTLRLARLGPASVALAAPLERNLALRPAAAVDPIGLFSRSHSAD